MKKIYKKFLDFKNNLKWFDYVRFTLWVVLIILSMIYPFILVILGIGLVITFFFFTFNDFRLHKQAYGNGIIYGLRRRGKGITLNRIIKKDKTKPFVNVPYFETLVTAKWLKNNNLLDLKINDYDLYVLNAKTYKYVPYVKNDKGKYPYFHTELLENIDEYFNSIEPLDTFDFLDGNYQHVKKNYKFEGRNVILDDIGTYLPNWQDSLLKKRYPSMPPFLAINGHTYGAYMIATTQDRERPYKILKELQGDFSIKAVKTIGWGSLWNCIPLLNYFIYTKYIWHELPKSVDMLPFSAKGLVNTGVKHAYLTGGQATKEVYEASNGKIKYGRLLQLKKNIVYDTRFFHQLVYGHRDYNLEQETKQ